MSVEPGGGPVDDAALEPAIALAGRTLGAYLDQVASETPAPGGGSVAGAVAALGAALGAMACRLSGERNAAGERGLSAEIAAALTRLERARGEAMRLAAADEAAYAAYRAAASLPHGDDRQRADRRRAMHAALVEATDTPLALASVCLAVLDALAPV
ncbi:MAG TPA: cyclodeaminase/cyclohydrolase family protein, partial [Thermomicrobiales bacterium]|nr:cyclodeaminase/cyclohydrolase family protein [Thermomicrobiales bacterium]